MYIISIPEISDEELMKRYKTIKPIVNINGTRYWLREYSLEELRGVSYIWYLKPDKRRCVDMKLFDDSHFYDFECLTSYHHRIIYEPKLFEILSQIPEEVLDKAVAFEVIKKPELEGQFILNADAFAQGFHASIVRLYFARKN